MNKTAIEALDTALGGHLIRPDDPQYDRARQVWNGMIDRRPALIARCRGTADVLAAVRFAREHGLPISVRGGGHNVAGTAVGDDAMAIDLSPMRGVVVDADKRLARVQGGALLEDVDREAQVHGLATPMGVVSQTGVAGLCLSGGLGWLRRRYGLTCDNLVRAEVVTGSGEVVYASESENPELLWGLRGGGGNFGVVTTFEFQLHPVGPEVFFTFVAYPAEERKKCYQAYRDFTAKTCDEVSTLVTSMTVPDAPDFPVLEARGKPAIAFLGAYAGAPAEGEEALRPLRTVSEPLFDFSGTMRWTDIQSMLDPGFPQGNLYYWKGRTVTEEALSDEAIERLLEHAAARPSPLTTLVLWHMGGAVARVAEHETAFGGRKAAYLLAAESVWTDHTDDEPNIAWARNAVTDFARYSCGGFYLNYPGFLENQNEITRATFGSKYERLQALKRTWDPDNMFRFNANIPPA
ncbi:FAD-binding oxidoreductase [Billgrantia desiderata]|uniref:FAD-binding oxidoreductase n=1 Tax=Billgrantia desiderata TaxID=52021 RepID=UPI00089F745E|nr:FAD-binding oxidoreductase [Halomonas desiderata]MCE8012500.1 FAD-binding oxidoreductase [Halomonas desiderata]SEF87522.1 FAD/FMN-containing dehydrogenase [Halomonas desiderata]